MKDVIEQVDACTGAVVQEADAPQGAFAELARSGGRGALVTVLAGAAAGAKLLVGADRATQGSLGSPGLDADAVELAEELMWSERSERRELGALTAEETALSIMAEVVAVKHGHPGGRLAHARGRIHEVGV